MSSIFRPTFSAGDPFSTNPIKTPCPLGRTPGNWLARARGTGWRSIPRYDCFALAGAVGFGAFVGGSAASITGALADKPSIAAQRTIRPIAHAPFCESDEYR